jgi:hypothetical protein
VIKLYRAHFLNITIALVYKNPDIIIYWLILSVPLSPKVITLSGIHCIRKDNKTKTHITLIFLKKSLAVLSPLDFKL